ncbi:hypothetical protein DICPUDRAFT_78232 [Dictyostelium purpureum]|uniref:TRAF-type domain-containing protein n=1 Tax=Dictyostelium purpureum TaxID=5786 RepID=F0ZIY8_DICPU|nr:uncharacterized protein DICPUDRAFT_78232 [Dictyostelium purpureum]EGC36125.1 hypothetical protein DICPUDRAFT_78232 [Dictyostelium purpureum]|eukprot:XP_003287382.1 hypothetical protein DICPUDRAFT_78232 [Dictyostelium purpureum]
MEIKFVSKEIDNSFRCKKSYNNTEAPCDLCKAPVLNSDKKSHEENYCPKKKISCQYCNKSLKREKKEKHLASKCPKVKEKCIFNGCNVEKTREEMKLHKESFSEHISLINEMSNSLEETKKKQESHSEQINSLYRKSDFLEKMLKNNQFEMEKFINRFSPLEEKPVCNLTILNSFNKS